MLGALGVFVLTAPPRAAFKVPQLLLREKRILGWAATPQPPNSVLSSPLCPLPKSLSWLKSFVGAPQLSTAATGLVTPGTEGQKQEGRGSSSPSAQLQPFHHLFFPVYLHQKREWGRKWQGEQSGCDVGRDKGKVKTTRGRMRCRRENLPEEYKQTWQNAKSQWENAAEEWWTRGFNSVFIKVEKMIEKPLSKVSFICSNVLPRRAKPKHSNSAIPE